MSSRLKPKIRAPRRIGIAKEETIDIEAVWKVLHDALLEIHSKNASQLSYEELYRQAYQLVLKRKGEALYDRVTQLEHEWLEKEIKRRIIEVISPVLLAAGSSGSDLEARKDAGERLVTTIVQLWEDHVLCVSMITDVLMYLDRVYCQDSGRPKIFVTSVCLFRDVVLRSTLPQQPEKQIYHVLEQVVLDMIELERTGHNIDRPLLKHCTYMLEGLYEGEKENPLQKLYLTVFEPEFLRTSKQFYIAEATALLQTADAVTYCRRAATRLQEETDRCPTYLNFSTTDKVKAIIDEEVIKNNLGELMRLPGTGVGFMVDTDRHSDLAIFYALNSRVDAKKQELQNVISGKVVQLGHQINDGAKQAAEPRLAPATDEKPKVPESKAALQTAAAIKWVEDVIGLKQKFDRILQTSFDSDQIVGAAISKSFADFINANPRSSEYVSLFFDENLRKGIKGKSEAEVDQLLENGITLLRYIADKDLFETYYKKHLSKRLLMRRSISLDIERQIISRMKMDVGNTLTGRLEAMFKDMAVSEDLTNSYRTHMTKSGESGSKRADFEVHILTSTMWPIEAVAPTEKDGKPRPTIIYSSPVDQIKRSFEHFYLDRHSGRKLTWMANMGTADIRATFVRANGKAQRHELNVPTYGMIILLLFNDLAPSESLTYEEILAKTNIPEDDLRRNLQSLSVAPKTRILKKQPMSREVLNGDKFSFNSEFTSPYTKIKVGVISSTTSNKVENNVEREDTEKKMEAERGGVIEAAIVRTMKQRKTMTHQKLMTEVIAQLSTRFRPDPNQIKRKIEALLEREYLERKEDSETPAYNYLA